MSLKRKYTVTITHVNGNKTATEQEAECMKTVDGAVVLMDWNEAGCTYTETAFFRPREGETINVVSVNV